MSIQILIGSADEIVNRIIAKLDVYKRDHPQAEIALYRQNPVSVRVRIIDPDFDGKSKSERHQEVWRYLSQLPEEVEGDISTIVLLTPDEKQTSFANFDFENPIPSGL